MPKIRKEIIAPLVLLVLPMLFFFVGIPTGQGFGGDSISYNAFATSIAEGHGYTVDGSTFSSFREPGYPLFVAILYKLFGMQNVAAVFFAQSILLGLLGVIVYRIFAREGEEYVGYVAGLATVLLPSYGLYAHQLLTEISFAFLLGALLHFVYKIALLGDKAGWRLYAAAGLVAACASLVRIQLIFFLPFLCLCYLMFVRPPLWPTLKKMALAGAVFATVVGGWLIYVHQNTGSYSPTTGRQEMVLYMRAVRAQLSYKELTQYAVDWLHRSTSGGAETLLLQHNEYHDLQLYYGKTFITPEQIAAEKKKDFATLKANPGHYLYGNLIEAVKLSYIEHDYSDFLNRYLRAGVYIAIYGLFLSGLVQLILKRKSNQREMTYLSAIAALFIVYNYLALTPFDTIPRYNTPYLFLYMVVGLAGVALYVRGKHHA